MCVTPQLLISKLQKWVDEQLKSFIWNNNQQLQRLYKQVTFIRKLMGNSATSMRNSAREFIFEKEKNRNVGSRDIKSNKNTVKHIAIHKTKQKKDDPGQNTKLKTCYILIAIKKK